MPTPATALAMQGAELIRRFTAEQPTSSELWASSIKASSPGSTCVVGKVSKGRGSKARCLGKPLQPGCDSVGAWHPQSGGTDASFVTVDFSHQLLADSVQVVQTVDSAFVRSVEITTTAQEIVTLTPPRGSLDGCTIQFPLARPLLTKRVTIRVQGTGGVRAVMLSGRRLNQTETNTDGDFWAPVGLVLEEIDYIFTEMADIDWIDIFYNFFEVVGAAATGAVTTSAVIQEIKPDEFAASKEQEARRK